MMVPLLLAVSGAVLVAQHLDPRSIYSARIHRGRAHARDRPPSEPTRFEDLLSHRYDVVSAAAPLAEIVAERVRHGDRSRPLYVVDQDGRLVGTIPTERLARYGGDRPPFGVATAADLAIPVAAAASSAGRAEILRRLDGLDGQNGGMLPVIDPGSGRPVGVARSPDSCPRGG